MDAPHVHARSIRDLRHGDTAHPEANNFTMGGSAKLEQPMTKFVGLYNFTWACQRRERFVGPRSSASGRSRAGSSGAGGSCR